MCLNQASTPYAYEVLLPLFIYRIKKHQIHTKQNNTLYKKIINIQQEKFKLKKCPDVSPIQSHKKEKYI